MKPHKHAELIKAWADGAEIQYKNSIGLWTEFHRNRTLWNENDEYRIKPDEPRLRDMYIYKNASMGTCWIDEKTPDVAERGTDWVYVGRIVVFK